MQSVEETLVKESVLCSVMTLQSDQVSALFAAYQQK